MQLLLRGFIFRVIFTGVGFLVSLLIAKLAGADQFGTLSLMIVNAAFIYVITGLGTDAAIVWHGITGKNYDLNKIFSFTVITTGIQLVFFYIIAILGYIFLGHTLLGGNYGLKIFFAEIVYFSGLVIAEKFTSLYYSQHAAKLCNSILAIVSLLLFIVIMAIWLIDPNYIREDPVWFYSLFIFIPSFVLLVLFLIKYKPTIKHISEDEYRSFSTFSVLVLIGNLIQFIAYRADYWIISLYYNHITIGIYAQATKFAQLLWIIPNIIAGLITPALKNEKEQFTDANLISVCRITFFFHLLLTLVMLVVAFVIYNFFLPNDYYHGFDSLLIMVPGYLFFIFNIIFAAYFSANRLLKINLSGAILCCTLVLLCDVLLIPRFSYIGAAVSNLIAYSITAFYVIFRLKQLIKIPIKDLFIIHKSDFKIFSTKL